MRRKSLAKGQNSPSSTSKTRSTRDTVESCESTPVVDTPATSFRSSPARKREMKHEDEDPKPSDDVVTEEMIKEESDLHESSQQQNFAESSSQVRHVPDDVDQR